MDELPIKYTNLLCKQKGLIVHIFVCSVQMNYMGKMGFIATASGRKVGLVFFVAAMKVRVRYQSHQRETSDQ